MAKRGGGRIRRTVVGLTLVTAAAFTLAQIGKHTELAQEQASVELANWMDQHGAAVNVAKLAVGECVTLKLPGNALTEDEADITQPGNTRGGPVAYDAYLASDRHDQTATVYNWHAAAGVIHFAFGDPHANTDPAAVDVPVCHTASHNGADSFEAHFPANLPGDDVLLVN